MDERDPSIDPGPTGPRPQRLPCEEWERLIVDAIDGALAPADSAAFEEHCRQCPACAKMLEEVRQGVQWLALLDREPQAPEALLGKILARTSGAPGASAAGPEVYPRPVQPEGWLPAPAGTWHGAGAWRGMDPRFLMTVAMAFFSIALTLNLAGVNFSQLRLSDLRPTTLRAQLTRRYYAANAQVVKYYENLRFVHEMEARMRDLRQAAEPEPEPELEPLPAPRTGSPSSRNGGASPSSSQWGAPDRARSWA